jgi:hypothetical protein
LTGTFTAADVRLEVFVGLSAADLAKAQGRPTPLPAVLTAILDTGANTTAVAPHVLQQFGLTPTARRQNQTAAGIVWSDLYEVMVDLPASASLPTLTILHPQLLVTALAAPLDNADVLFELDLLLNCRLFLDGPALTFTLDF